MKPCPHCPDGHTPPDGGSQPWAAWLSEARDGDGQPTTIQLSRSGGAHVAESDAQWLRELINDSGRQYRKETNPVAFENISAGDRISTTPLCHDMDMHRLDEDADAGTRADMDAGRLGRWQCWECDCEVYTDARGIVTEPPYDACGDHE